MSPSVTKSSRILVRPQGKTPSCNLRLSSIDKLPVFQRGVDLIQVFTHGLRPAMAIKEALSLALNHYYPLAGRLVLSPEGELEIFCTGDGVWFVEAFADCTLEDVNFLELPLMITDDEILPYPRPGAEQKDAAIVLIQINMKDLDGIQVPMYVETGCCFNRQALYGYDHVLTEADLEPNIVFRSYCGSRKKGKSRSKSNIDKKRAVKRTESSIPIFNMEDIDEGIEGAPVEEPML